jgi:MFS superfamily sulfate permease-like transporter
MALLPTGFDSWMARSLAESFRLHPQFSQAVQAAVQHNVLGGLWFGMALLICWTQGARKDQAEAQARLLTVLIGSALTILLTVLAGALVSWPPPVHTPGLANLFPDYLVTDPNTNSFPS